jgi:hypothetical protein
LTRKGNVSGKQFTAKFSVFIPLTPDRDMLMVKTAKTAF